MKNKWCLVGFITCLLVALGGLSLIPLDIAPETDYYYAGIVLLDKDELDTFKSELIEHKVSIKGRSLEFIDASGNSLIIFENIKATAKFPYGEVRTDKHDEAWVSGLVMALAAFGVIGCIIFGTWGED